MPRVTQGQANEVKKRKHQPSVKICITLGTFGIRQKDLSLLLSQLFKDILFQGDIYCKRIMQVITGIKRNTCFLGSFVRLVMSALILCGELTCC